MPETDDLLTDQECAALCDLVAFDDLGRPREETAGWWTFHSAGGGMLTGSRLGPARLALKRAESKW